MKKLLSILALSAVLFSSAYGESSTSASVSYDASSMEAFTISILDQAEKEGCSFQDAMKIYNDFARAITEREKLAVVKMGMKYMQEKGIAADKITDKEEKEIGMIVLAKYMQGKTFKEMQSYVNGGIVYDFSSEEAFKKSILAQAEKEGFSEKEAMNVFGGYMMTIMSENKEDFDNMTKKASEAKTEAEKNEIEGDFFKPFVEGKTLKEMKEYVKK